MVTAFRNIAIHALAALPLLFTAATSSASAPRAIFAEQDIIAVQVHHSLKNLFDREVSLLSLHARNLSCDFEIWNNKAKGEKTVTVTLYKTSNNGAILSHLGWAYGTIYRGGETTLRLENNELIDGKEVVEMVEAAGAILPPRDQNKTIYIPSNTYFQKPRLDLLAYFIGGADGLLKLRTFCHEVQLSGNQN